MSEIPTIFKWVDFEQKVLTHQVWPLNNFFTSFNICGQIWQLTFARKTRTQDMPWLISQLLVNSWKHVDMSDNWEPQLSKDNHSELTIKNGPEAHSQILQCFSFIFFLFLISHFPFIISHFLFPISYLCFLISSFSRMQWWP